MARMSQYSFSANQRSLRNAWDRNGMIVGARGLGGSQADGDRPVPEHHQWQVQGQPRQRAAEGSQTKINSSPSTTQPGTISPTQPQRTPGVRNFSLFGGAYTWSSAQEKADLANPNFNRATRDVLKQPAVAAKPLATVKPAAPAAVAGPQAGDPFSAEADDYSLSAELASVGAGNGALSGAAGRSMAALTRTGVSPDALAFGSGIFYRPPEGQSALGAISPSGITQAEAERNRRLAPELNWGLFEGEATPGFGSAYFD